MNTGNAKCEYERIHELHIDAVACDESPLRPLQAGSTLSQARQEDVAHDSNSRTALAVVARNFLPYERVQTSYPRLCPFAGMRPRRRVIAVINNCIRSIAENERYLFVVPNALRETRLCTIDLFH